MPSARHLFRQTMAPALSVLAIVAALLSNMSPARGLITGMVTAGAPDIDKNGTLAPDAYRARVLEQFRKDAMVAAARGVQLLVYPEFAFVSPTWSAACKTPSHAITDWCPSFPRDTACGLGNGTATFATALACAARDANMTLSFNVCEGDGVSNWNSQAVFLPDGTMKAIYRKTHPYMKKCYAAPAEPDLVYFTSKQYLPLPEEAPTVGIFTCKDILYKHPSIDLYAQGVRVFIYSSKIPLVGRLAKDIWTKTHPGAYLIASDAANNQSGVFINGSRLSFESSANGRVVVTEI